MNVPPQRVCVAGGSGFVGRELVKRLAGAGHAVRVLTRQQARASPLRAPPPLVEQQVVDYRDEAALCQALGGADVVVNLVGILNERGRSGRGFWRAHVEVTAQLLRAALAVHAQRFLQMSALGADAAGGASHYLRSKGAAEQRVFAHADQIDYTIFRPSVIFGCEDSLTNRFAALLRLAAGLMPLARASTRFAPIHVGDVAEAFMRALAGGHTSGQTFELCGAETLSLAELVQQVARARQLPCHVFSMPDALGWLQAALLEFLPGKPLSLDNFRSLLTDSVCREDGCAQLGLHPKRLSAWLAAPD
jgi:NADH dehydrogenase